VKKKKEEEKKNSNNLTVSCGGAVCPCYLGRGEEEASTGLCHSETMRTFKKKKKKKKRLLSKT